MDGVRAKMSSLTPFAKKHKVTVIGSGNWGSTIGKMVAENTAEHPELFERDVQMWVYEEEVEVDEKSKHYDETHELCKGPQKLTAIINTLHENVKYLPGIDLPHNLVANPSLTDAVKNSSILIFNLPHQFILNLCKQLRGHILPFARGISCIKGVNVKESSISLFSETIGEELGIYCGALSGANIAKEIAQEKFSETTIAYDPPPMDSQAPTPATSQGPSPASSHVDLTKLAHKDVSGNPSKVKLKPLPSEYQPIDHDTIKKLFHRRYFHVRVVSDVAGVSLGGALKNIVAVAAGWVDGLGWGDNAKAAVMRVGLLEMREFGNRFFPHTVHPDTFTVESAGVADLITTCSGGRNHRCAKLSIMEGKSIEEIEARELNGQKLQGAMTAHEVNTFLKSQGAEKDFPLMTAVHNVLVGNEKAENIPDLIEPEDEDRSTSNTISTSTSKTPSNKTISRSEVNNGSRMTNEDPRTNSIGMKPSNSTSNSMPKTKSSVDPSPSTPQPDTTNESSRTATRSRPADVASTDSANLASTQSDAPSSRATESETTKPTLTPLIPAPSLASSRYNRQLLVPQFGLQGQQHLLAARVLIIGLGGLGCPAALYLAGAGVGTLGLMDGDVVETNNLHRQIAHTEAAAAAGNTSKVESARDRCAQINSEVRYELYPTRATPDTLLDVLKVGKYDVVLDCTDNPATRYLVSDACVVSGTICVSGAAQRGEGSLIVLNNPPGPGRPGVSQPQVQAEKGPCYRCVFPRPPPPEMVRGCSEIGILGPVVGVIGTLMAGEAIKIIAAGQHQQQQHLHPTDLSSSVTVADAVAGAEADGNAYETTRTKTRIQTPSHTMLLYNTYASDPRSMFRTITLRGRRKDCLACGDDDDALAKKGLSRITADTIAQGRLDYQAFCGVAEDDVRLLDEKRRVGAREFLEQLSSSSTSRKTGRPIVVDVREEHEFDLGAKVSGSVNIPISRILRAGGGGAFDRLRGLAGMEHKVEGKLDEEGKETHNFSDTKPRDAQDEMEDENHRTHDGTALKQERSPVPIYFVCHRGNDSQIAAQKLIEHTEAEEAAAAPTTTTEARTTTARWGWIGDVKGGFVAMERFAQPRV